MFANLKKNCHIHDMGLISGNCDSHASDAYGPLACETHSRLAEILALQPLGYDTFEQDGKCISLITKKNQATGKIKLYRCANLSHPKSWFCQTHHGMGEKKRAMALSLCYYLADGTVPMDWEPIPSSSQSNYSQSNYSQSNYSQSNYPQSNFTYPSFDQSTSPPTSMSVDSPSSLPSSNRPYFFGQSNMREQSREGSGSNPFNPSTNEFKFKFN